MNAPYALPDLKNAVDNLVIACHGASYYAGWWQHNPSKINLREVLRGGLTDEVPGFPGLMKLLAGLLVSQKLLLTVTEIAEATEGARKDLMDDKLPHHKMITVELADAIIRACDLAGAMDLPLGQALVEKMAFNAVRPDHKPENRAAVGGKAF